MGRFIDMNVNRRYQSKFLCIVALSTCTLASGETPQRIQDVIEPNQNTENPAPAQAAAPSPKPPPPRRGKAKRAEATPPQPTTAPSTVAHLLNGTAQAARDAGVVDCLGRINQVTNFVAGNNKTGVFLFIAPIEVNRHIVSASLEIVGQDGSAYASTSFAPIGTGGCGAVYETIANWAAPCEAVARSAFASFKPVGGLGRAITMLDGGQNARVFLLPAVGGCTSIKKEVVYP